MMLISFLQPNWGKQGVHSRTKALLNLQTLEFSQDRQRRNGMSGRRIASIKRLRADLSIQVLREYDFRKQRYGSRCVVPIERGICTGCQVTPSLQTNRAAQYQIVECEHCGRLLYNPERHRRLKIEVCAV